MRYGPCTARNHAFSEADKGNFRVDAKEKGPDDSNMDHDDTPPRANAAEHIDTVLQIFGMRNNSCRDKVSAALERVPGVIDVAVNLYRGNAIVRHAPDSNIFSLIVAIHTIGFGAALPSRTAMPGMEHHDRSNDERKLG